MEIIKIPIEKCPEEYMQWFEPCGVRYMQQTCNDIQEKSIEDTTIRDIRKKENAEIRQRIQKVEQDDLFGLLDISDDIIYTCDNNLIKTQYDRICIILHPDKCINDIKAEERYQSILQAYQILRTLKSRQEYLSILEDNEEIPIDEYTQDTFYEHFNKIFLNESKFSQKQPVPKFGDQDTPMNNVLAFYNFWFQFQSWKTFPLMQPYYTIKERRKAYIKQWIKQNSAYPTSNKVSTKEKNAAKKNYNERIQKIVTYANEHDPRIIKYKEQRIIEKKLEKDRKRQLQKNSNTTISSTNDSNNPLKKNMYEEQEQIINSLQRLEVDYSFNELFLEELRNSFNYQMSFVWRTFVQSQQKVTTIDKIDPRNCSTIFALLQRIMNTTLKVEPESKEEIKPEEPTSQSKIRQPQRSRNEPWTTDDINLLIKATQKYPVSIKQRWELVTDMMSTVRECTVKDVIKQAKKLEVSNISSQPTEDIWSLEQQKQFENALRQVDKNDTLRWEKISQYVTDKTPMQIQRRYNMIRQRIKNAKSSK